MPDLERIVAGIRCREVLADLSDYLDGVLPPGRVRQIEAHVRDCDWCARFGGEFAALVTRFRELLGEAEPLSDEVSGRLRQRLRREFAGSEPTD